MIKRTALIALLSLSSAAVAQQSPHELCSAVSTLANNAMVARQNGEDMATVIDNLKPTGSPGMDNIARSLVIDAYGQPRYTTTEYRRSAVSDFASGAYHTCITRMR